MFICFIFLREILNVAGEFWQGLTFVVLDFVDKNNQAVELSPMVEHIQHSDSRRLNRNTLNQVKINIL